jgi:2-polyprenyl-6-methoxyphenol hydroxylase-like FAD-dependent oxidoreductase
VIIGGGIAGCATALALATRGVDDVVVIDAGRRHGWRIGEAIPPAARIALNQLGLWNDFRTQRHLASTGSCASWGNADLRFNDFMLDPHGLGWHLDRAAFDEMLASAVAARGGRLIGGLRLREAVHDAGSDHVLSFEGCDGSRARIAAGFLIDATGIAAGAVRRLGVARNQIDCLTFISGIFDLAEPDAVPTRTLLEACHSGWWYMARLPHGRLIAALAVDPSAQRNFREIGPWMAALRATRHAVDWLSAGKAAAMDRPLHVAQAPSAILSRVADRRWLAVGDAASACDPLLSQGITKAMHDGVAAARGRPMLGGCGRSPAARLSGGRLRALQAEPALAPAPLRARTPVVASAVLATEAAVTSCVNLTLIIRTGNHPAFHGVHGTYEARLRPKAGSHRGSA